METTINFNRSTLVIKKLFKVDIEVYLYNVNTLKKRLKNGKKYPFKDLFGFTTSLDKVDIKNLKNVDDLIDNLENIPKIK